MSGVDFSAEAKPRLVSLVREQAAVAVGTLVDEAFVASVVAQSRLMMPPPRRQELIRQVLDDVLGAGPLAPLLRMDGVSDVVVNAPDRVYIDAGSGMQRTAVTFDDEDAVRECASRLARLSGRRLDDAHPFVDARLPSGERLHAMLPPISATGTLISIRVPRKQVLTWQQLASASVIESVHADAISEAVADRASILITGGTGSGKTTLLNSLLAECDDHDRIVVVEDTTELVAAHPHVVQLECRPANADGAGRVAMTDLVRQSLRMRPDRIVVGEVRGPEIVDLLMALNTGHTGCMATMHANRPADVPARIEVLAASCGLSRTGLMQAIASAFTLVVHMQRDSHGRRVIRDVARVIMDAGEIRLQSC